MFEINRKTKLNEDTHLLKLIALISMIIDHIGAIILPSLYILRIIGRLAFPLFAYSTFVGYFKTKDFKKYLFRVLLMGIISQPIYMVVFSRPFLVLNIFFTLAFELLILYVLDKKHYLILPVLLIMMMELNVGYCYQMILLIPIFVYLKNYKILFSISFCVVFAVSIFDGVGGVFSHYCASFGILALPLILTKTSSNIKINKWFYYLFYPVHLLTLYLINCMI